MRPALLLALLLPLAACSPNAQYRIACASGDASACQALRDGTAPPPFWGPGGTLIDTNAGNPQTSAALLSYGAETFKQPDYGPPQRFTCQTVQQGVFTNTTCN